MPGRADPAGSAAAAISALRSILGPKDVEFFAQIRASGTIEGLPFVRLWNGDVLLGYTDPRKTYYRELFERYGDLFMALGLGPEAHGAAFDALRSYHYENSDSIAKSAFVRPGSVVIDVGVRGGHFAVKASRLAGDHGVVVCVDPTAFSMECIAAHIRHNGLRNVRFVRALVADVEGRELEFHHGSEGETFSGIFRETIDDTGAKVVEATHHHGVWHLHARTIDGILEEQKLSRTDLLVMQINGGEVLAIRGAERCLANHRPVLFITCFQRPNGGASPKEGVVAFAHARGYRTLVADQSDVILVPS